MLPLLILIGIAIGLIVSAFSYPTLIVGCVLTIPVSALAQMWNGQSSSSIVSGCIAIVIAQQAGYLLGVRLRIRNSYRAGGESGEIPVSRPADDRTRRGNDVAP